MVDRMQSVSQGGLFHVPKVKYSRETESLIRELIRESKLSIFQRKQVEKSVRNGDPLPLPPKKTAPSGKNKVTPLGQGPVKYTIPRRRKLDTIKKSGAFDRDKFHPSYSIANNDIEKRKLQELMAFGKTLKSGQRRKRGLTDDEFSEFDETEKYSKGTIIQDIMDDIEERKNFLERMEAVGRGKMYRDVIQDEILGKLNLIDKVNEMFKGLELKENSSETNSIF